MSARTPTTEALRAREAQTLERIRKMVGASPETEALLAVVDAAAHHVRIGQGIFTGGSWSDCDRNLEARGTCSLKDALDRLTEAVNGR